MMEQSLRGGWHVHPEPVFARAGRGAPQLMTMATAVDSARGTELL